MAIGCFCQVLQGCGSPSDPSSDRSIRSFNSPPVSESPGHVAGASVEETLRQHRALPDPAEEIWWRATGATMAWRNKNIHQFVPTVNVYRAGQVRELGELENPSLVEFPVAIAGGSMTFDAFLASEHSTTMGLVVLHSGQIVFERYPRMQPHEKPIWWSVTKVFVSTLVAILEDRGLVDVDRSIEEYLPELAGSDFAGVTVRHVLDMASGVDCPDGDYSDRTSCYMQFEASLGDAEWDEGSPENPYDYLADLRVGRWAEPGVGFDYSGANTFVLGWLVEKVTDDPFQDVLSREIWTRAGMQADASIYAGRGGTPLTSGGLLATVRDVARFGLLFTPSYSVLSDQPILSDRYLELLEHGGDPKLLERARHGGGRPPGVRHNVYQWDRVFSNDDLYKGGWAGQGLLINRRRDLVAAWVGYSNDDASSEASLLPILREVLEGIYGDSPADQATLAH